jgi:signal transduction histidine kinase
MEAIGVTEKPTQHGHDESMQIDRWMATLAHELRAPLNAVVLGLDEIRASSSTNSLARAAGEMASGGALQMARIITDILELSQVRHRAVPLKTEHTDFNDIARAALRNARPIFLEKQHQVDVELPIGEFLVETHPSRLEQILTNLLTNAAKYTPREGRVRLEARPVSGMIVIRVRDNGIGIRPQFLPHVFDLYRRDATEHSRPSDGLGIGLALVKSLVQLLGGTVKAHSYGPGEGSEFVVRIPGGSVAAHRKVPMRKN